MAQLPNSDMSKLQREVIERGEHLFQQLGTRDMPSPEGHLVMEMDVLPQFSNVAGRSKAG